MEIERWNGTDFLDGLKIDWDFLIGMFSLKFYSFIKTRKYYQDIRIVFTIQWIEIKSAEDENYMKIQTVKFREIVIDV